MCLLNSSLLTEITVCRLHYQSAVTSSQSLCQRNPVGGKIALWPSFCQGHLNLGNNSVTCLWNLIKLTMAQKQCHVIIWLNFNRGISTMLGNYSGPWWSGRSVPWLNLGNQKFSMRVENVIETSHWKLLISGIRPRHTSTALAAHLCVVAHRLGSTALEISLTEHVAVWFSHYTAFA